MIGSAGQGWKSEPLNLSLGSPFGTGILGSSALGHLCLLALGHIKHPRPVVRDRKQSSGTAVSPKPLPRGAPSSGRGVFPLRHRPNVSGGPTEGDTGLLREIL